MTSTVSKDPWPAKRTCGHESRLTGHWRPGGFERDKDEEQFERLGAAVGGALQLLAQLALRSRWAPAVPEAQPAGDGARGAPRERWARRRPSGIRAAG